jgi:two-component system sensor histidine kinase/response regulator
MNGAFFFGLINNAALLLAMVFMFSLMAPKFEKNHRLLWKIFAGIILGTIGLAVMSTNWELIPGVIFDTRSVLLGITGLFFGSVPTLIAMFMTIGYRIYQGGSGVLMGVPVIIESCLIGLVWGAVRYKNLHQLSWLELYIFGLLIHAVMLLCTFFLPADIRTGILTSIWLPVMVIYPVATLLLGVLMSNGLKRDILEKDLIESEEKFAKVFKNGPQMITISSLEKGIFLDVNDSMTEILGYEKDKIIGKSSFDINIWVNTADRKKIIDHLEKGKVIRNTECRFRKKNGEIVTCLVSATTIEIAGEKYLLLLGVNIEDRKKAERELTILNMNTLAEKHKLEAILRDMGDAVFVTDDKKKIILANRAMELLFGLTEKEMLRKEIEEVLVLAYETSGKKPVDLFEKVFEKKVQARPVETLVIKSKKGTPVSVDGVASPIVDENSNLIGTVWLLRDVTKQRELEQMREDFVSLASHQLRTPLTGIKWFAELLHENAPKCRLKKFRNM